MSKKLYNFFSDVLTVVDFDEEDKDSKKFTEYGMVLHKIDWSKSAIFSKNVFMRKNFHLTKLDLSECFVDIKLHTSKSKTQRIKFSVVEDSHEELQGLKIEILKETNYLDFRLIFDSTKVTTEAGMKKDFKMVILKNFFIVNLKKLGFIENIKYFLESVLVLMTQRLASEIEQRRRLKVLLALLLFYFTEKCLFVQKGNKFEIIKKQDCGSFRMLLRNYKEEKESMETKKNISLNLSKDGPLYEYLGLANYDTRLNNVEKLQKFGSRMENFFGLASPQIQRKEVSESSVTSISNSSGYAMSILENTAGKNYKLSLKSVKEENRASIASGKDGVDSIVSSVGKLEKNENLSMNNLKVSFMANKANKSNRGLLRRQNSIYSRQSLGRLQSRLNFLKENTEKENMKINDLVDILENLRYVQFDKFYNNLLQNIQIFNSTHILLKPNQGLMHLMTKKGKIHSPHHNSTMVGGGLLAKTFMMNNLNATFQNLDAVQVRRAPKKIQKPPEVELTLVKSVICVFCTKNTDETFSLFSLKIDSSSLLKGKLHNLELCILHKNRKKIYEKKSKEVDLEILSKELKQKKFLKKILKHLLMYGIVRDQDMKLLVGRLRKAFSVFKNQVKLASQSTPLMILVTKGRSKDLKKSKKFSRRDSRRKSSLLLKKRFLENKLNNFFKGNLGKNPRFGNNLRKQVNNNYQVKASPNLSYRLSVSFLTNNFNQTMLNHSKVKQRSKRSSIKLMKNSILKNLKKSNFARNEEIAFKREKESNQISSYKIPFGSRDADLLVKVIKLHEYSINSTEKIVLKIYQPMYQEYLTYKVVGDRNIEFWEELFSKIDEKDERKLALFLLRGYLGIQSLKLGRNIQNFNQEYQLLPYLNPSQFASYHRRIYLPATLPCFKKYYSYKYFSILTTIKAKKGIAKPIPVKVDITLICFLNKKSGENNFLAFFKIYLIKSRNKQFTLILNHHDLLKFKLTALENYHLDRKKDLVKDFRLIVDSIHFMRLNIYSKPVISLNKKIHQNFVKEKKFLHEKKIQRRIIGSFFTKLGDKNYAIVKIYKDTNDKKFKIEIYIPKSRKRFLAFVNKNESMSLLSDKKFLSIAKNKMANLMMLKQIIDILRKEDRSFQNIQNQIYQKFYKRGNYSQKMQNLIFFDPKKNLKLRALESEKLRFFKILIWENLVRFLNVRLIREGSCDFKLQLNNFDGVLREILQKKIFENVKENHSFTLKILLRNPFCQELGYNYVNLRKKKLNKIQLYVKLTKFNNKTGREASVNDKISFAELQKISPNFAEKMDKKELKYCDFIKAAKDVVKRVKKLVQSISLDQIFSIEEPNQDSLLNISLSSKMKSSTNWRDLRFENQVSICSVISSKHVISKKMKKGKYPLILFKKKFLTNPRKIIVILLNSENRASFVIYDLIDCSHFSKEIKLENMLRKFPNMRVLLGVKKYSEFGRRLLLCYKNLILVMMGKKREAVDIFTSRFGGAREESNLTTKIN